MARSSTSGRQAAGRSRAMPESKVCASCGRSIEWRAKWARSWEDVRYCSSTCRRRGVSARDRELEQLIVATLRRRPRGAIADLDDLGDLGDLADRAGGTDASALREQVRRAARRLADRGLVEWMQGGAPADPSTARGRVGIRLRAAAS